MEIKFRVRDNLSKKIIGYEALFPVDPKNNEYQWAQSVNNQDWTDGVITKPNVTREQFTGVRDKNRKEIYFGDHVSFWHTNSQNKFIYDVIFNTGRFLLFRTIYDVRDLDPNEKYYQMEVISDTVDRE